MISIVLVYRKILKLKCFKSHTFLCLCVLSDFLFERDLPLIKEILPLLGIFFSNKISNSGCWSFNSWKRFLLYNFKLSNSIEALTSAVFNGIFLGIRSPIQIPLLFFGLFPHGLCWFSNLFYLPIHFLFVLCVLWLIWNSNII